MWGSKDAVSLNRLVTISTDRSAANHRDTTRARRRAITDLAHIRILVVDDESSMRLFLVRALGTIGIKCVEVACDGQEAFEKLEVHPYDLILSDWNMQPMDGLELLKRVRADASISHTPFIMMSAHAEPESITRAKQAGVDAYILKPFSLRTLTATIKKVCSITQA